MFFFPIFHKLFNVINLDKISNIFLYVSIHISFVKSRKDEKQFFNKQKLLGVQLCFRRFPIDGFSGKWWSK